MKVPQMIPWIGKHEYEALAACFEQAWITEGPKSEEFLEQLLELIGARYGVLVPNGTLGLYLALRAMGIGPEDEVIVPDFTFIGSANAVEMTGARPVFVDVNSENYQIDVERAGSLVSEHTKAIMPVHIYGTAVNMDMVSRFAKDHNLMIIEDAAQAISVYFKGQHAGSFGDMGVFSFFADKTITTGEGGLIVTNNPDLYRRIQYLRNQGRESSGSFIHPEIGYNFRITDLQAAVGIVQLSRLPEIVSRKEQIRRHYTIGLKEIPEVRVFVPEEQSTWVPFRMPIECADAQQLIKFLGERGVETRTYFYPLHKQECYGWLAKYQSLSDHCFPNTINAFERGLCLPSFPELESEQIDYIVNLIGEYFGGQ